MWLVHACPGFNCGFFFFRSFDRVVPIATAESCIIIAFPAIVVIRHFTAVAIDNRRFTFGCTVVIGVQCSFGWNEVV